MLDTPLRLCRAPKFDTPRLIARWFIDAEPLLPAGKLALYISERQKWDSPHHDQRVGSIQLARIIENIRAAFELMGWTLVPDSG